MKQKTLTGLIALTLSPFASADLPDVNALEWNAITFGQSTDLNFGSTILPEKVGTNQVTVDGKKSAQVSLRNTSTLKAEVAS